jgi:hypothetical protein
MNAMKVPMTSAANAIIPAAPIHARDGIARNVAERNIQVTLLSLPAHCPLLLIKKY